MKITKKTIIAIASFLMLLLQAFGLKIDLPVINEAISALAGVLVMLGIISDGSAGDGGASDGAGNDGEDPGGTDGGGSDADDNGGNDASGEEKTDNERDLS